MFRVKVESKLEGNRKQRRQVSTDTFITREAAEAFVESCISKQKKFCWLSWGMLVTNRILQEDGKLRVEYRPACTIFASLTQTFEIVAA